MAPRIKLDTIGKRLRFAREARGLRARELARRAHLKSESHPGLIEGERQTRDVTVLAALAHALGVSLDWLVSGGETPKLEPYPRPTEPAAEPAPDAPAKDVA